MAATDRSNSGTSHGGIRALVDNCVGSLSQIMEGAHKEQTIRFGDREETVRIAGFRRKPERSADQTWMRQQFECLPGVARLARQGSLTLFTYNELRLEAWQRPGSYPALPVGDLFDGVTFHDIGAAIERSRLFQSEDFFERERLIEFCRWLLHPDAERLAEAPTINARFPTFELENFRNLNRFRKLCEGLADAQLPDAFHLWTGETHELDFFLTTDRKFIRAMRETKRIELPCRPISPEELLTSLGETQREPLPYKPGRFYSVIDAVRIRGRRKGR